MVTTQQYHVKLHETYEHLRHAAVGERSEELRERLRREDIARMRELQQAASGTGSMTKRSGSKTKH